MEEKRKRKHIKKYTYKVYIIDRDANHDIKRKHLKNKDLRHS